MLVASGSETESWLTDIDWLMHRQYDVCHFLEYFAKLGLEKTTVAPEVATEPEATEPEATEPEATEPEATEPEATEPEATEPEPEPKAEAKETEFNESPNTYVKMRYWRRSRPRPQPMRGHLGGRRWNMLIPTG
jgi:hypothetical protein